MARRPRRNLIAVRGLNTLRMPREKVLRTERAELARVLVHGRMLICALRPIAVRLGVGNRLVL